MEIGKLYQTKKIYWFLFPSKDLAATSIVCGNAYSFPSSDMFSINLGAAYWRKHLNCNVSYISPSSIFMLLEENGNFCKVLSTEGKIGWIYFTECYRRGIEEVKAE
jgi:hypothetical protein